MRQILRTIAPCVLPACIGALCGALVAPPFLLPDTATGLLSWRHFIDGGEWNTLPIPDPENIMNTLETAVTWWSPGQYVPLGVLTYLGLSLGSAMLVVAFISAILFGAGLMLLGRDLGAHSDSLRWIGVGATGCWFTLHGFGMYNGGELALIAVFPWIALFSWRLRTRPSAIIVGLPVLFLIGSFAKHSFAIYGVSIIIFIWIEALRDSQRGFAHWFRATYPLVIAGLLYIIGRYFIFDQGVSPADSGQINRSFATAWGFGSFASLLAATGLGSIVGRLFYLANLTPEVGWGQLTWILCVLSPVPLAVYLFLSCQCRRLDRFAGITCLVSFIVLLILISRGGSISIDDRHYRPAGALLLAVLGACCSGGSRMVAYSSRVMLAAVVLFGIAATLRRHIGMHEIGYPRSDGSSIADVSPLVLASIREVAQATDHDASLLYLPFPVLGVAAGQGRIWATDLVHRDIQWINAQHWRGRVPTLTLVLPHHMAADGRAAALKASFSDYASEEWVCRSVGNWDFWQAHSLP